MIQSDRAVLGEPPGGFSQGEYYSLWLSGKPILAKARDWYMALAGSCPGPVEVCECHHPLIGPYLASCGVSIRQLVAGRGEGEGGVSTKQTRFARWEKYPAGEPVGLVALPLGCIQTAWRSEARREAFARICGNLSEGGRLVLDARNRGGFPEKRQYGIQRLSLEQRDSAGGSILLWETWRPAAAGHDVFELGLAAEAVSAEGIVQKKRYSRYLFAALSPLELEADADSAGLSVESVCGGFSGEPLASGDGESQVWVFKKDKGPKP